ncbi:MAG: ATP-grasp domain-containing protein [Candidatus Omnitrophica bacterium]|nr:ATP-grasp domain-containing protein [Candidatus Omnitrophota bacterium]
MRIGIAYDLKSEYLHLEALDGEYVEEFDAPQTIEAISRVLEDNGFEVSKLGGGLDIVERIKEKKPDFVFNITEGYRGRNREAHIPCILEMLNIPYSGSDVLTLSLTLDKIMTKKIAHYARIPTPRYVIVDSMRGLENIGDGLEFPLISKPAWEGSSKGIYNRSLVYDKLSLEKNLVSLFEKYPDQPLIVEEYIKGREFTVGIIGNQNPSILGIMEIRNKAKAGCDFLYSLEVKRNWENEAEYISPPEIPEALKRQFRQYAKSAFVEFGCRDFARIDFRLSQDNRIYLLEINPLPGLSPISSDLVIMEKLLGISYEQLILSILKSAFTRYKLSGVLQNTKEVIAI